MLVSSDFLPFHKIQRITFAKTSCFQAEVYQAGNAWQAAQPAPQRPSCCSRVMPEAQGITPQDAGQSWAHHSVPGLSAKAAETSSTSLLVTKRADGKTHGKLKQMYAFMFAGIPGFPLFPFLS